MGRRLRMTVPTLPMLLDPALPDSQAVAQKEKVKRDMDAQYYNKRHRTCTLTDLSLGHEVWVTDT